MADVWAISGERNQLIKIDGERHEVKGSLDVGRRPCSLAVTAETVWVVAYEDETLVRVDANRFEITARIAMPHSPNRVVAGRDGVWVGLQVPQPRSGLARVDPASNHVQIYPDRGWPAGQVGSEFWLYQHRGFDFTPLVAIDPATGQTADRFLAYNIGSFAIAGDSVWVSHQGAGRPSVISRLDPASGDHEEVVAVPGEAMNLAVIEHDLWFSSFVDPGFLGRLDMRSRQLTAFDVPLITDMSPLGDQLWICARTQSDRCRDDTGLRCFDVRAGKVTARIECGTPIQQIAIA